jgi:hypothetical protein
MNAVLNTDASIWKLLDLNDGRMEKISKPRQLRDHAPPILFIHGVEFHGPEEAMKDLVAPMLQHLGIENLKNRSIYLLTWNSLIVPREKSLSFFAANRSQQIIQGLLELMKCRHYMNDVEKRAKEAAQYLQPFILEWNSHGSAGPIVITHSMGSLVWAEALRLILESSSMLIRPGIWWSLQPALQRGSLTEAGEYRMVSKLYTGHESARAMIWYSRLDFILSSLYLLSKRTLALGQFGCPQKSLPQRDVTSIVGEAHGMSHITRIRGDFFRRAGQLIAAEAANLGII